MREEGPWTQDLQKREKVRRAVRVEVGGEREPRHDRKATARASER